MFLEKRYAQVLIPSTSEGDLILGERVIAKNNQIKINLKFKQNINPTQKDLPGENRQNKSIIII